MRRLGLSLSILLAVACASPPRPIADRDTFPLDPREGLAGPFDERVALGWEALTAGDAARAEEEFRRAEEAGEGLAAGIGLIEAWVVGGGADRALAACERALRAGEPTAPLLVACGEAHATRSEPVEALALYETALARSPGREGLRARAAELRKAARDGLTAAARQEAQGQNWEAARARVERAIEVDPKDPQLRVLAAEIERGAGHTEKALERYREALELGSPGPEGEEKIAELALESGDHATAVSLFDALARRDPKYADRAAEARFAFRVTNWPAPERDAAQSPRLTRADAAILVWWMVPEVREARVSTGVIATDVVSRRDSRAVTRALALGFLDVDPETHRASPDAPLSVTAASRLLLRLLEMLRPIGRELPCLTGVAGVSRSVSEAVSLAISCGLLGEREGTAVGGPEFTRALDRIRAVVGSGENARRE